MSQPTFVGSVCVVLIVSLITPGWSVGQEGTALDRVTFGPVLTKKNDVWSAEGSTSLSGEIKRFDADKLVIALPDGRPSEVDSDRVEHVSVHWNSDEAKAAMELVDRRRYREAVTSLDAALKSGLPQWQQRLLIAKLVQCADALGNPRTAGILFLNLAAASPPALLYADMPLCWTVREPDRALVPKAEEWLASSDESAKLLGASWLLFSRKADVAQRVLTELQSSQNTALASLAVAQSWRLIAPPESLDKLPGWFDFRDNLVEPLQIGPTEFIADRMMRIGQVDLAIGQWMRIATIHPDRYHRAANALQSAASLLKREGRNAEAERLKPWIEKLTVE